MGKPIAGRNKSPFGVDGINVDAAVLSDGTQLTNVRISKQRSINVFDLISADGATLYPFVKITGVDATGANLSVADDATTLAGKLANGTFCIGIVDADGDVAGFAIRLLLNKVVLQDGSVQFLTDYTGQGEPPVIHVTGVSLDPTTVSLVVGATAQVDVNIVPSNAANINYDLVNSDNTKATIAGGEGLFTITGVDAGTTTITVTTDDGSFTATCVVTVTAAP